MSERLSAAKVAQYVEELRNKSGLNISFGGTKGYYFLQTNSGGSLNRSFNFGSKELKDIYNYIYGALTMLDIMQG